MGKHILRLCAVVLAFCLCFSCAAAEAGWLDAQLAPLLGQEPDTAFSLGIHLNQLYPFGDETLTMLNGVLEHIRVEGRVRGEDSAMAFSVGGESLFTLNEGRQGQRMALTTDLLENRLLVADTSPMDALSGNEMAVEQPFELERAIGELEGCWQALAEAIVPYAEEKQANYRIDDIGRARWVRLAKLSAEDGAALAPHVRSVLECGMDAAFRSTLEGLSLGDEFTVALYSDQQDGTPIALYMKGNVYLGEELRWSLAWQWAFADADGKRTDTYRYELTAAKAPKHKRVLTADRSITEEEGKLTLARNLKLSLKDDLREESITGKDRLTATRSGSTVELSGKLETTVKDQSGKETVTTVTTITPALTMGGSQGTGTLTGSVQLTQQQGKTTLRDLFLTFHSDPVLAMGLEPGIATDEVDPSDPSVAGSSLSQNVDVAWEGPAEPFQVGRPPLEMTQHIVPAAMTTIDLSQAEEAQLAALLDEMAQNCAGRLLIALARLPGEPLALLTDNMTAEDYQVFLSWLEAR